MENLDYGAVKNEIKQTYDELLELSLDNSFLTQTELKIKEAIDDLDITGEEKAKSLITLYSTIAEQTLSKTFEQAMAIVNMGIKLPKEAEELDAKIDLVNEQKSEVSEAILDRQSKRVPEVNILIQQELLIKEQINKLKKDIDYVEAQKDAMLEQVQDNKVIKGLDSIGDTIGTIGNGGIQVPTKMFELYFQLHNKLVENSITDTDNIKLTKI